MSPLSKWIKPSYARHRRPARRPAPGLTAYKTNSSNPVAVPIKDISSTGVYLETPERWIPGDLVSLSLQKDGPPELSPERRFDLKARTVRWGDDGMGLAFVLPSGMKVHLWEETSEFEEDAVDPEDVVREFRIAEAGAFLRRISPDAAERVEQLMRKGLSRQRCSSALAIAVKAEELLAFGSLTDRMRVHPDILVRVFEDGSWAEAEWLQHFWAGLLATSCTLDEVSSLNLALIDVFSQLTPIHARILAIICAKAAKAMAEPGWAGSHPPSSSVAEIIEKMDTRELVRIDRDLGHLENMELIKKIEMSSRLEAFRDAPITPTDFGLELNARCNAYRGEVQSFYSPATFYTTAQGE